MKRIVLSLIASAAVVAGASVAVAQNSPSTNTKINDGINGAPNYNTMAPAGAGTAAKINDGINGAPNYNPSTATVAPKAASRQAASVKSTRLHATHHKRHTPAS
jgi:hypothetical protein